jgi:lipoprotein-releasing system ATP-binding protein
MAYLCRMLLQASGIYKSYGPLSILKGVDISVDRGEIVSIVGKSGSGKSTLLHILGTLDNADQGTLDIVDKRISLLGSKQLAAFRNQHIGFVFQFHHLLPEFTALENVSIPGYIAQRKNSEVEQRAKELLDYLGLSERLNHKPGELSGGEQQRVAVARALINQPEIIFADEPTGNLDSSASRDFHQLIRKLCDEQRQTFVIVTHNQELADLSDRRLTMADGQLHQNG